MTFSHTLFNIFFPKFFWGNGFRRFQGPEILMMQNHTEKSNIFCFYLPFILKILHQYRVSEDELVINLYYIFNVGNHLNTCFLICISVVSRASKKQLCIVDLYKEGDVVHRTWQK